MNYATDLQYLKGVGPKMAERLEKLGLKNIRDCLYFFPRTYEDRGKTQLGKDFIEHLQTEIFLLATVLDLRREGYRTSVIKTLLQTRDNKVVQGIWFNQPYLEKNIRPGMSLWLKGKLDFDKYHKQFTLTVADYEILKDAQQTLSITPIYSLTEGMYQKKLRQILRQIINECPLTETLPSAILREQELLTAPQALREMHFPTSRILWKKARQRLVFEELFLLQLQVAKHYHQLHQGKKGLLFDPETKLVQEYIQSLPYQLTGAQKKVFAEIQADVNSGRCMNRLLQGDVGSGKTEVATLASLLAIGSGYQVALMVPTEVLALQHTNKITAKLNRLNIRTISLLGKHTTTEKREINEQIASGEAQVIIDEQHRFGVLQRDLLIKKGTEPHILVMTATPIPRSLSLTVYGDLDKSIIDELPPGRLPITTSRIKSVELDKLTEFMYQHLERGQQAYVVYPLIAESEKIDLKAAITGFEYWRKLFPGVTALLHGKLSSAEKEEILKDFNAGKTKVLVSTTVIEVGVDVPQATIMIIEDAHRFGLAQLHQLRGRVGRGGEAAYCFLVTNSTSSTARKRLNALVQTTDGFVLAELDLEMRGAGDYIGVRQSGMPTLLLTDLIKDNELLQRARKLAFHIIKRDPELTSTEYAPLKKLLSNKLGTTLN